MALYDNKSWLLSHIRNSFISTDDTGMCELVMVGEDIPRKLPDTLDAYNDPDESDDDEDEYEHESYDIQFDIQYRGQRSNTVTKPDKMEQAKKRAVKIKHIKWEKTSTELTENDKNELFKKKESNVKVAIKRSLLTEQLEKCTNLPQNPYMEYTKFDGSAQVGIPTRKYKIFLTMLPEEQRNYPMTVCCIATAKIQDLIGLICLKCSTVHGDFPLQPVPNYGLYITEDDGEVDRDFACLDPKECVAKFGFTCLGLAEHKSVTNKTVSFENTQVLLHDGSFNENSYSCKDGTADETKQLSADMQLMDGHTTAMEAPLYQSYPVYIINKVRAKVEINLGISGEKIEILPIQQKSSKFALVRQKAVSHQIDAVAWCEITDTKSNRSSFRVVYSLSFGNSNTSISTSPPGIASPVLQTSASFKHYDFEADHHTAKEIVQKINLILELRSSTSRKEYLAAKERKQYRKKSFNLNKGVNV